MAIDVRAISITGAFNAIKSFFQSQENNSRWKDMNTGAEGNFLTRMLATVIRVISQNCITGRRENNLETANLVSSNIGIGVTTCSYPVFRGRNQRRYINFTPNDNMTIPMFTKVGTYSGDYGIYTLNDLTFVKNEPQNFYVVIGKLNEITWRANTTNLKKFVRFEQGISEDIDLLIDGVSMTKANALSKHVKDMIYDKYCVLTNPHKSVTVQYLNNAVNASHKYSSDTEFTLVYIELEDISSNDFTNDMFAEFGTLNSVLTIENYVPFEDNNSIKFGAPIYREAQSLVRSKKDFPDLIQEISPSIKQTTYDALTPTYTSVSYMKNDKSLLEDTEYKQIMLELDVCNSFGRPLPDITHPIEEVTTLDITLGVTNNYLDESSITADVQSIVNKNYAEKLNGSFNKYDLENLLNKINYVKYSRVEIHQGERTAYTTQRIGDTIEYKTSYEDTDGKIYQLPSRYYRCTGILGTTGINEPNWNKPSDTDTVENIYTGIETVDGDIIWACYKRLNVKNLQPWSPEKKFQIGEFVTTDTLPTYMFKAVDLVRYSYREEPDVSGVEVGEYITDDKMILLCITYNASYPDRINSHQYRLGDKFNIRGLSFEYVGMKGNTGSDDSLHFEESQYNLLTLTGTDFDQAMSEDGQVCLYIDDTEVASAIKQGSDIEVTAYNISKVKWEELPDDKLTMNSKITAKVKEYEDSEDDSSSDSSDEITPTTEVSVVNYYTGNTIPDISDVNIGDSIYDGEFTITRVPYEDEYPERISAYSYNNNDHFTITVFKEENGEEVLDYAKSFVVVAPTPETTVTRYESDTTVESDNTTEADDNANWKELEKYLALQDEVQEWITSEGNDKLRCPMDVITFFAEIGRITSEEKENLIAYYNQYDEYDEHQIYMFMDSMKATRLDAIKTMSSTSAGEHCHQLKTPISDANCVRQYDENNNLVYVDRFNSITTGDSNTGNDETPQYAHFTVDRYNADGINRGTLISTTKYYIDGQTVAPVYDGKTVYDREVTETVIYTATVASADVQSRNVRGNVKLLTRIKTTKEPSPYAEGSVVNISFDRTNDGDICWEQMETTDSIEYGWNTYANYDINLTIKY